MRKKCSLGIFVGRRKDKADLLTYITGILLFNSFRRCLYEIARACGGVTYTIYCGNNSKIKAVLFFFFLKLKPMFVVLVNSIDYSQ